MPNVTFAFEATSAAISFSSSQVHFLSSGTSILAFSKIAGLAKMHALLMPALMPTSLPSILPESTVPSANLETSVAVGFQVQQGAPGAVLGDVGHVHLDDVRRVLPAVWVASLSQ